MTDNEITIREVIRKIDEVIVSLVLQKQSLSAQLPETKTTARRETKGYRIDPVTGKKRWYDKKEEKKHNRAKLGLTLKGGLR